MSEIFSLQFEKSVIAGLLQHSEWIWDVDRFLNEKDFYSEAHQVIYNTIKLLLDKKETITKEVVADRINHLGISLEISIYDYLKVLNVYSITKEGFIQSVKELKKLSVRREISSNATKIITEMKNGSGLSFDEIIGRAQNIFNQQINLYENSNEPEDLFKGAEEEIEKLGENPVDEVGLVTPYKSFNRLMGGFTKGDLYIFAALAKVGKSTILSDAARKIATECNPNKKIKVLIADTEMETFRVRNRQIASLSGIPEWYIKSGNWRKNEKTTTKVRDILKESKKYHDKIYHIYVGDKNIDEICSIFKRWKHKYVKEDEEALFIYDYIKVTNAIVSSENPEWRIVGLVTTKLKDLGTELQVPVICCVQLNRAGQAAQSQRIEWFCSGLFVLERKNIEDFQRWGNDYGTHKLIPRLTRNQGRYGDEVGRLIEYNFQGEKEVVENYINLEFKNFNITDMGTAEEMINGKVVATDDNDQIGDDGLL